jgi:hypothetical protein
VKRYLAFVALSAATAFIYWEAWALLNSAVLVLTDGVWSLSELCIGISAVGVAWLVRRYAKTWPLALCCVAGALPAIYVWLFGRAHPMWNDFTGSMRWALFRPFVILALALPAAFLVMRLWPSNKENDAPKARA